MKHIYLSICLLIVSTTALTQVSNGLVAYYKFNGNADDSSPNGNHGLVSGAVATTDNFGNAASAMYFDGINDHITIPHSMDLKPALPLTISCWVKIDESGYAIIFNSNIDYQDYYGYWIGVNADQTIQASIGDGGNINPVNRRTKSSSATLPVGSWHMVTAVIRSGSDMDIYIDCANAGGSYSGSGGAMMHSTGNSEIFYNENDAAVEYSWGSINDLAIWNRALTAGEITSLCNNALAVDEPELVSDLTAFPNPTTRKIMLTGYEGQIASVTVIDALGKTVAVVPIIQDEIDLGNLPQGIYLLDVLSSKGNRYCERIVLEH
jgi:hypothetical protein